MIIKKKEKMDKEQQVQFIMDSLSEIYKNKSCDEYKCHGDITKSPNYESIEYMTAQLSSLKRFSESDTKAIKNMFNVLHRPVFGKMVTAYLAKPDERNIIFTACFTCGYRLLVGELSRIFSSTEATDKGIVYKPDKVSRRENVMPFIRKYNSDIDKKLDALIKATHKKSKTIQEASIIGEIDAIAERFVGIVEGFFGFVGKSFKSAEALNPVSLISAVLSRSYDKKVEKYNKVAEEYEAAKKAYDEYMKIPSAQRNKRIEHRYTKMIEKYNIKMNNLKAKIDHYDLRAQADSADAVKKTSKKDNSLPQTSSTVDTSSNKKEDDNDGDKEDEGNSDFDF